MSTEVELFLRALYALTSLDYYRLYRAACRNISGTGYHSPNDLVAEVISTGFIAAAGGPGRHWPVGVPFMAYLFMSIRGVASDARRSLHRWKFTGGHFLPGEPDPEGLVAPSIEQELTEDYQQVLKEEQDDADLDLVRNHFKDDPQIQWVIRGIAEKIPAREIQALSGMTAVQYASALRRWNRGLTRLFPQRKNAS